MFTCINGYTKQKMKDVINKRMLDHASVDKGYCVYRAPDGNACGVGVFISDADYHQLMDTRSLTIIGLLRGYPILHLSMPLETEGLGRLQEVHDHCVDDPRPVLCKWIDENVADPV